MALTPFKIRQGLGRFSNISDLAFYYWLADEIEHKGCLVNQLNKLIRSIKQWRSI